MDILHEMISIYSRYSIPTIDIKNAIYEESHFLIATHVGLKNNKNYFA